MLLTDRRIAERGINLPPATPPADVREMRSYQSLGDFSQTPSPHPAEGGFTQFGCDAAQRVQLAGGELASLLVHPMVTPFEQLYRKMSEDAMYMQEVSPETPFVFTLGAFRAPEQLGLLLFDLRPDVYRFSGLDPGDTVPVENRRFSSIMGFDLTVDGIRSGNLLFEIDPQPIDPTLGTVSAQYQQSLVNVGESAFLIETPLARFNAAAANAFASAAGAGLSLLPQRPHRYGPLSVPFTLMVRSGQTVLVRCVIFRPIPSPIAFIEYDIAGMLFPQEWINSQMECMKPLTNASGGPGSLGGGPR